MKSNVRAVTPKAEEKPQSVDREKTCPLLLRVFTSKDRHHRPDDFGRNQTPANELQVYTWMDATLKEITNLVKEVHPESRKKGMIFDFAICYQVTQSFITVIFWSKINCAKTIWKSKREK